MKKPRKRRPPIGSKRPVLARTGKVDAATKTAAAVIVREALASEIAAWALEKLSRSPMRPALARIFVEQFAANVARRACDMIATEVANAATRIALDQLGR